MSYSLGELAEQLNATLHGDAACKIDGIATITSANSGQISFLANSLYKKHLEDSQASAIILSEQDSVDCPIDNILVVDNPQFAFCQVVELFHPPLRKPGKISDHAVVDSTALISGSANIAEFSVIGARSVIAEHVIIGSGTVIEDDVSIGEGSLIHPNVTICRGVTIGNRVIIHPGVVIGADGFGLANHNGTWKKIPQIGAVIIEEDVEIGANTTIDRGAIDHTVIKTGVKIDNQIQIGHNCYIGEHTAIAACTGISGSTKIGKRCMIGGGSGFNGHLNICDDVTFTGFSMVTKSITEPGVYSSGIPLKDNLTWRKNVARFNQLSSMAERISALEKKLEN